MRISTKNQQAKTVNVKRGPTVGNVGTGSKRSEFMSAKAKSGSERSALADSICEAVAARGRGMMGFRDQAVEPLKPIVNVGRGPRKGNRA